MSAREATATSGGGAARLWRQTMVIARRDFVATVFTPTFLLFLFAPLLMISFGAVGGLGAASLSRGAQGKDRIVAFVAPGDAAIMREADKRLRRIFRRPEAPSQLIVELARGDAAAQARAAFDRKEVDVRAVLYGPLDKPQIIYGAKGAPTADYLAQLAEDTLRIKQADGPAEAVSRATKTPLEAQRATIGGRSQAAFFSVFGIFFLTLMLAGQAVGTMAEERGNKVIEILAAAVPLESVFLGKLIGMFGVAILFIAFWGTVMSQIGALLPITVIRNFADVGPATGIVAFTALFFAYFTMAYMLLGAVFLGVGAQASTMREIQMLSLPITIVQMGMFGLASAAAAAPGTTLAYVAEIFPLSSPFAMVGRAASSPEIWPHFLALGWQAIWVAITIVIAARAFRRGVLQSGNARLRMPGLFRRGLSAELAK